MRKSFFFRSVATLILLPLLLLPGCGIIFADKAKPFANSLNSQVNVAGSIVDQDGKPLRNVRVIMDETRAVWDPIWGVGYTGSEKAINVDRAFHFQDNVCSIIQVTFQKDGYYPEAAGFDSTSIWREYSANGETFPSPDPVFGYNTSGTGLGGTFTNASKIPGLSLWRDSDPRNFGPVRIVMQKQGRFTTLAASDAQLVTSDHGALGARWQGSALIAEKNPAAPAAPPGIIYIDATRDGAGRIVTFEIPYSDGQIATPRIKLQITGSGNGFIRRPIAHLPSLERQLKEAPESGYGEAIFAEDEIGPSWFFVRINGLYGRGCVGSCATIAGHNGANVPKTTVSLQLRLWMQPDGTRNLETRP